MRDKAWRMQQRARKIAKRLQNAITEDIAEPGRLDKTHFGCGCHMCKPWKHNAYGVFRFKHSEEVQFVSLDPEFEAAFQDNLEEILA